MRRTARRATAIAFSGLLFLGGAACSDEDGDGANLDEEIDETEQQVDEEIEGQEDD